MLFQMILLCFLLEVYNGLLKKKQQNCHISEGTLSSVAQGINYYMFDGTNVKQTLHGPLKVSLICKCPLFQGLSDTVIYY